ncbi:ABC transporter permease [Actinomadura graeca]|uniref:ABC transporter permease n=1 Tax=Actinomadura graeca TaxID=2750812 RepID=A0ABX8QW50_9ACTN|nr:ABC transporter permease [Actinomadura graeca]QXJ22586.1 ABC transporter permease [Actinomadura graeca]
MTPRATDPASVSTTASTSTTASGPRRRPAKRRRLLASTRVRVGLALTLFIVVLAFAGPFVAPHSPSEFVGAPFAGPSGAAPLGTDQLGRDVLSRVLGGGRLLVWMSLASAALGMLLGAGAGLVAGYAGGWLDELIMRIGDVVLALPVIVFAMLFVSLLGMRLWLLVLLIGIAHAPQVARVTRGVTAEVARREFVGSAEALGMPRRRILLGEILPNVFTPLTVEFGLRVVWSIAAVAGLSVLGAGIRPPTADWGLMINEGRDGMAAQPPAVIVPVLCIAIFAFGVNLVAEGMSRSVAGLDRENGA